MRNESIYDFYEDKDEIEENPQENETKESE